MEKKNYFDLRNINPEYYKEYKLPAYLKKSIGNNKAVKILDIGCGYGQTLIALRKAEYENISGIDISEEAVKYCVENNLDVVQISDIASFADRNQNQYDYLIMSHVLEHLPKEAVIETLEIIRTKLVANNGKLCIMVPNAQSNTGCYWAYEDFTHYTLYTTGSLMYVLKAAGYDKITFLDPRGIEGFNFIIRLIFRFFQFFYILNKKFWNLATLSYYHKPSPVIYTYEIKVLAE